MTSIKAIAAAIIMPGLLMSAGSIANAAPGDAGAAQQCKVTVDRSQAAGVLDVTRQVFEDGNCLCYAYTGPKPQADSIEGAISTLLNTKECPDAKVQQMTGPIPAGGVGGVAGSGGGLGGIGTVAPIIAGGAAAAALAAGGGGNGPSSP